MCDQLVAKFEPCGDDDDNMNNFFITMKSVLLTLNPSKVSWLWPAKFKLSSLFEEHKILIEKKRVTG